MSLDPKAVTLYRSLVLPPRQATLLGLIWIAIRRNQERGAGALVGTDLFGDLVRAAQNRGLIASHVHFQFDSGGFPHLKAPGLRLAMEELKKQGFLHIPETGRTIGFLGMSYVDLPVGIFRHIDFFGFADLVDEFTGGRDDE